MQPPFLDISLPIHERARDLMARLTRQEKIGLLTHNTCAVPRLGIPAYNYWSEALHGVARNGRATVFPQAIGLGATWDPELIRRIASAIGDEGRAKYHAALQQKGSTAIYQGLNFWSPNINIFRDPRWGRGQETYGEDPYLTGELGAAFVRGLQGDDPRYLKAAACAKHFAVHSGPEAQRHAFNVSPSKRDLHDTYLPAFKKLVQEARVEAVMGAYNAVYDVPCNASEFLLTQILRKTWGFEGHVVADCGAISDLHHSHKYTRSAAESTATAIKAGCDLFCDHEFSEELNEALERGLLSEADVDASLARTLTTRFKLGMFDPADQVPYAAIPMSVVGCKEHRKLAYEAAVESIVLLKNKNNVLPIKTETTSIMVTGPNAAALNVLLGNYYGFNERMITVLEGITEALPEGMGMEFHQGTLLTETGTMPKNWSIGMAAASGLTIACMGLSPLLEGEEGEALLAEGGGDRSAIELPKSQVDFLRSLYIAGARIVLVLFGGGPVALGEAEDFAEAILQAWYPGQEGGRALADVLFGNRVPSGKLPITFPKTTDDLPPFDDYSMAGRTYRYSQIDPLYPFGYGLSYSNFNYSDLCYKLGETIELTFTLTNTGRVKAAEVIQVYLSALDCPFLTPVNRLAGFQRVELDAGEAQQIVFNLSPELLVVVNEKGDSIPPPGPSRISIGGCSPSRLVPAPLTITLDTGAIFSTPH